ncbi:unnamed protein product, partial [marine sediment metagenome]
MPNLKYLIEKNQSPTGRQKFIDTCKYDWTSIRRDYVEGCFDKDNKLVWSTLSQIADKYKLSYTYLRQVASTQKWSIEKQNYRTNYEHAKQTEKIHYLARKAAKFDGKCIAIAEAGIHQIETMLTIAGEMIDDSGKRVFIDMDMLESMAKTLDKFQKIGRLALGSSTDNLSQNVKNMGAISLS